MDSSKGKLAGCPDTTFAAQEYGAQRIPPQRCQQVCQPNNYPPDVRGNAAVHQGRLKINPCPRGGCMSGPRCQTKCTQDPIQHSSGINGIKFTFCHHNNWDRQMEIEERGSWDWQGMKLCPRDMYVVGFKTKLQMLSVMRGLAIICGSVSNSLRSEVLVYQGEGNWRGVRQSVNYAIGFKIKRKGDSLSGLGFSMAAMPKISHLQVNYAKINIVSTRQTKIGTIEYQNFKPIPIERPSIFSFDFFETRGWFNNNSFLHTMHLDRDFTAQFSQVGTLDVPYIADNLNSLTTKPASIRGINFGTLAKSPEYFRRTENIMVGVCERYSSQASYYSAYVTIPYNLTVTESNGFQTQAFTVGGHFKGIIASDIQVASSTKRIC